MVALASVVSEDVVVVDDFVKGIIFKPCLLYEVDVKLVGFHGGNEVLISGIIMWVIRASFAIRVARAAAESVCILGENFADDVSSVSWQGRCFLALDGVG